MWYTRLESSDPTPHTDIWEEEYVGLTARWVSLSLFFLFFYLRAKQVWTKSNKSEVSWAQLEWPMPGYISVVMLVTPLAFNTSIPTGTCSGRTTGSSVPCPQTVKRKPTTKWRVRKKKKRKKKNFRKKFKKKIWKKKIYIKKKKNKQLQQETRKQMLFTDALHCTRYKHLYIYLHSGVSLSSAFSLANSSLSVNQPDNATTPPSWRGYLQAAKSDTAPPWLKPPRTMFFANIPFSVSSFPMIVWIFCTDYV